MRNLDECKAEIFRLGEEKIKERKKRRKLALSACIPLCLCLVVCSFAFLPERIKNFSAASPQESPNLKGDEYTGETAIVYLQAEIKGFGDAADVYNQVDEANKINHIAELIERYYSKYNNYNNGSLAGTYYPDIDYGDGNSAPPQSSEPTYQAAKPENQQSGYIITFKTATDYKAEYSLSGNILKNNSTNERVFLTSSERTQLLFELTRN